MVSALQLVLGVFLAGALLFTVVGYKRRYGALSARSRLFRTVGLFLLDLLLILFLAYTFADFKSGTTPAGAAVREILYLTSCVFLGLSIVCVAILDSLESIVAVRRERKVLAQEMIRDVVAQISAAKEAQDQPAAAASTTGDAAQPATVTNGRATSGASDNAAS